jgi:GTP cyclohydrolase I
MLKYAYDMIYPRRNKLMLPVDVLTTNGTCGSTAPPLTVDYDKIATGVRLILEAIGEDPEREGLRDTATRVARMYAEVFQGLHIDPRQFLSALFDEQHDEMVLIKDIPFYSMCEHHLLPFHGIAHVAYLPSGKVVGLSKIARVVEALAQRPQVQERLTSQIADLLMDRLSAHGVAVVMEATHTCMTMRGVKKPGSATLTSAMRGTFKTDQATRSEFMSLILRR